MARGGKAFKAVAKGMAVVASAAAVIERQPAGRDRGRVPRTPGPAAGTGAGRRPRRPPPWPRHRPRSPAPRGEHAEAGRGQAPVAPAPTHGAFGRELHPGRPATPAEAVPWGLRVAAESTWRLLLLGAALYVVFMVVDMLRLVAFAVLASLLISALLEPTVSWLRRRRRTAVAGGRMGCS